MKNCLPLFSGNTIEVDPQNSRIKIYQLPNKDIDKTIKYFKLMGLEKKCNKIIFYLKENEINLFSGYDLRHEGIIKGFFQGKNAYIYSMFLDPPLIIDPAISAKEEKVMEIIKSYNLKFELPVPKEYVVRTAKEKDAPKMAQLYDTVFKSYPTPMNDPQYIVLMMNNYAYYTIVEHNHKIISACAATVLPLFNCAEMTDCATLPEYRRQGLLSYQYSQLIKKMKSKGLQTLFCYSRSVSIGMNLVNIKHGFIYGGCLIQNSNISEQFEKTQTGNYANMNIWYKQI
jgi:putative beta-lysine N-acetyltransferase